MGHSRLLLLLLPLLLLLLGPSPALATSSTDCPSVCLPPYTHKNPASNCTTMCHVCLNATTKGCTSYFLPYFYGNNYSGHFACWETCPMPNWAWGVIAIAIFAFLLMVGHCIWYCAHRRKQNRDAAMQMFKLQNISSANAYPPTAGPGRAMPAQAPAAPPKGILKKFKNPLAKTPPTSSFAPPPPASAPAPSSAPAARALDMFQILTRTMPRQDGGGWGVRSHPAYARLEQAENSYNAIQNNPCASERR